MSPAAEAQKTSKASKLGGKEFEETFKPNSKDSLAAKDLEGKNAKGKKKKSKLARILIIITILIVLIAGAGAALYFSGSLNSIFVAVGLPALTEGTSIEDRQAALDKREAELNDMEKSLEDFQVKLEKQQKTLEDAQSAAEASANANRTFEQILAELSEEKIADLKQVGAIYSKMDAAAAAAIMTKIYDDQQIAIIIYHMQAAASALVFANMDAELAARVTQILTD